MAQTRPIPLPGFKRLELTIVFNISRIKYVSLTYTQHTCPSNTTWNHHCELWIQTTWIDYCIQHMNKVYVIWDSTLLKQKVTPRSLSDGARSQREVGSVFLPFFQHFSLDGDPMWNLVLDSWKGSSEVSFPEISWSQTSYRLRGAKKTLKWSLGTLVGITTFICSFRS